MPAPLGGVDTGIGPYTRGALLVAKDLITAAYVDHPLDQGQREALLLVLSTGEWTDPTGTIALAPAHDPKPVASDLFIERSVPTYVVALGGPGKKALADALASAGFTGQSVEPTPFPIALVDTFVDLIEKVKSQIDGPICVPGMPRVMVLLDASSSMLNDGAVRAAPGEGSWDLVRDTLAGADSVFEIEVAPNIPATQEFHFGLSVFGSVDEQKVLVQYGGCNESRFQWALDPASACDAPGCLDPYALGPVKWTFKDGSLVSPPGFDTPAFNHMPRCDLATPQSKDCSGSGSATHLGLELVHSNLDAFRAVCLDMGAQVPCYETTPFLNVLITDGAYDSTDAQVQAPLTAMHADGFITHVIGFGDDLDLTQLGKLADWGSGGLLPPTVATTQDQLEAAFQAILVPPVFDPCCPYVDCNAIGEGTVDEENTSTGGNTTDSSTGPVEQSTGTSTTADTTSTTADSSDSTANLDDTGITADPPTGDGSGASDPSTPTSDGPGGLTSDDSSASTDADPSESASDKGCACSSTNSSPPGALLWFGLLGLLGRSRRPLRATRPT